ncbi:MAG: HAD-IIIA family hydrolase [Planctomycetes bacterium]|jgi:D-glycero-D-manno-heptose 1,7-bisphosphate phosphatase|nr:HAD-IIIA family hydrolase [Planctomycetota bacterium]
MRPAVFLDRDNTIIHNDGDLGDPDGVRLIQGAASAIASLCGLGYKVVVVTNQGGVARGKYKEADVEAVNQRLDQEVRKAANGARIDAFYFCPFHPEGNLKQYRKDHPERKPHPGMLQRAARELKLDLGQSWMVGDQLRDIQAGAAAGTRTVLVGDASSAGELDEREAGAEPDFVAANLTEAVRVIAQQRKPDAVEQIERAEQGGKRWDAAAIARIQRQPARPREEGEEGAARREPPRGRAEQFRPWNAPPPEGEEERPPVLRRKPRPAEEAKPAEAPTEKTPPPPAEAPTLEEPPPGAERTLRLILQELRQQRNGPGDFNALSLGAIVLQLLALICLGGALVMPEPGDLDLLLKWLGAAVIVQLATLALLLFARAR